MSDNPQEVSPDSIVQALPPHAAKRKSPDDLIGAHPVAMSVGAATGGAAAGIAAGMAIVTFVGPVGTALGIVAGAVAGAVGGGLASHAVAERMNPTFDPAVEHRYWRKHFARRPYTRARTCYEEYAPAYQYGWEAQARHLDQTFDQVEARLKDDWDKIKGTCMLGWKDARDAIRDSWDRVSKRKSSR